MTSMFLFSCSNVNFDPPANFVTLKQRGDVVKFVAADASAIKITYRENQKNGTAKFWSDLLKRELISFKGYKLIEEKKYKGSKGYFMTFRAPYQHKDFYYSVAILTNTDDIYVLELGCLKKVFPKYKKNLTALMDEVYKKKLD